MEIDLLHLQLFVAWFIVANGKLIYIFGVGLDVRPGVENTMANGS